MGLFGRIFQRSGVSVGDAELEAEGVLVRAPRSRGSITYRHYRAPGRRMAYRRVWMRFDVILTKRRLLLRGGGAPVVDLPWDLPAIHALEVSVEQDALLVAFDAAAIDTDRSGRVEVRVLTADAAQLVAAIEESRRRHAAAMPAPRRSEQGQP